jgi:hypothetical protein
MINQLDQIQIEKQNSLLKLLCSYLLFERKQESQLSIAFSILCQERHNQFHTIQGDRKMGDVSSLKDEQSDFSECNNEICMAATEVLRSTRSMAIEINNITTEMVSDYEFHIAGSKTSCRAWMVPKTIEEPKIILTEEN